MADESDPAQAGVNAALEDFDKKSQDGDVSSDDVKHAVQAGAGVAAGAVCVLLGVSAPLAPLCALAGSELVGWIADNAGPILKDIGGAVEDAWDAIFGSGKPEYHLVEPPGGKRSKQETADAHFVSTLGAGVVELGAQLADRLLAQVGNLVTLARTVGVKYYAPTPPGMTTAEYRRRFAIPIPMSADAILLRLRDHGLELVPVERRLVGTVHIERSSSGQALLWPYALRPPDFRAEAFRIIQDGPSFLQKANDLGALGQRVIDWGAAMYRGVAREATTIGVDAIVQQILPANGAPPPTHEAPDVTVGPRARVERGVTAGVTFLFT